MIKKFWDVIGDQLTELRTATTAADVLRILSPDRNPYRLDDPDWDGMDGAADAFFAGGGGGDTVDDALDDAQWTRPWFEAPYWWAMQAPDGTVITYCEGDIYQGDKRPKRI